MSLYLHFSGPFGTPARPVPPETIMITKLIGIATLFAAGSVLPAAPAPTLGAREVSPATMAPLQNAAVQDENGRCGGRRCAGRRCAGRRCAGRRCAGRRCAGRRCASQPSCGRG
jgi:hypothetical protein